MHLFFEQAHEASEWSMYGLYIALLYLRRDQVDSTRVVSLFNKLFRLLGPMPDVLAIGWELTTRDPGRGGTDRLLPLLRHAGPIALPPMLSHSWRALLHASRRYPGLIAEGSLAEWAIERSGRAGAWYIWWARTADTLGPPMPSEHQSPDGSSRGGPAALTASNFAVEELSEALQSLARRFVKDWAVFEDFAMTKLSALERFIAQSVNPFLDPTLLKVAFPDPEARHWAEAQMRLLESRVMEIALNYAVPPKIATNAVASIMNKLDLWAAEKKNATMVETATSGVRTKTVTEAAGRLSRGREPHLAKSKDQIRIKLFAYDGTTIQRVANEISTAVKRTGAIIRGPVSLPTRVERFTVNRSPHIDKKSREQFEIRTHKRLIDIEMPNNMTIDALNQLHLPAGVEVKIRSQRTLATR